MVLLRKTEAVRPLIFAHGHAFIPSLLATPDGTTLYAMTGPDWLAEHQRIGRRYRMQVLEVKTYADRLHVASPLERVEAGWLVRMRREEYAVAVRNIGRRWNPALRQTDDGLRAATVTCSWNPTVHWPT